MTRRSGIRSRLRVALPVAAAALALAVGAPAVAAPPDNNGSPVTGKPMQYVVQDPGSYWTSGPDGNCSVRAGAFAPTTYTDARTGESATSRVIDGVKGGAAYQIEVPANWNGDLVLYAHGYNGTGAYLCVQRPNIDRAWYLAHGYAWAASSYATNGYDVPTGVKDTHALVPLFTSRVGRPDHVWLTGESMGGHVVGVSLEQYPAAYDGAMPVCGVLGDQRLFDYFYDANATAAALAGVGSRLPFPTTNAEYTDFVSQHEQMTIGGTTLAGSAAAYGAWAATVVNASGGSRPGALPALYGYWNQFGFGDAPIDQLPFLLGLYPGTSAGTLGIAHGNVVDNTDTVYRTSLDPTAPLSPAEQQLNAAVKRIAADPSGSNGGLNGIPVIEGTPSVPVLSLHGTGDLFVPFSMEQIYQRRVAAHGDADLLVQRAVRTVAHCGFTQKELTDGFTALVGWAEGGARPAGDDVSNPAAVAAQTFGCRFTDESASARAQYERSGVFFGACPAG
jgi:hypothetical protein